MVVARPGSPSKVHICSDVNSSCTYVQRRFTKLEINLFMLLIAMISRLVLARL